ncbi:16S rRNA (cytosine(967)-C(5))-methyltransferase RsmB [Bradymonas sediminis]|uniref:16S rRNA (cytosine(967)-C(5))-methyltransferase n=1 Tax=Bradymonas sediminis TaxID=1548548 RepID=A0A2Z4FKJ9_9DELT|nr:16S rRNA (cytosine(967)-C(5))-methyltransferase RsmB [Bradymonas sediminis]AWV89276.1 16S rRNA (cytosine(967)-C(5))-methyltransferase RsmB [Bradymonas sediminis]TDP73448.1 16S rRNA (cytosine967-C5)-methyltransferase [Bradymonas sediminis]
MPRQLAQEVLEGIEEEDAYSHISLDAALRRSNLDARDRGLATELVYGTLTWQRSLDTILGQFLASGVASLDLSVRVALRLAVYQIVFLDRIPPHAAVNQAVEIVKAGPHRRASGLVNGVLRNLLRQEEPIQWWRDEDRKKKPSRYIGQRYSIPNWLGHRMLQTWGLRHAEAMAASFAERPPLYLRKIEAIDSADESKLPEGVSPAQFGDHPAIPGAYLAESIDDTVRKGLEQGEWVVQDLGSQLIGYYTGANEGMSVLDACAGLGGKTLHLADLVGQTGTVNAVDPVQSKLQMLRESAEQTGLLPRIATHKQELQGYIDADATRDAPKEFDLVLLDAPCSGLGVIRRHPETRWRREKSDIIELAEIQKKLLEVAAGLTKSGGILAYSVCTFTREEGAGQVASFLEEHPEFELIGPPTEGPGAQIDWAPYLNDDGQLFLNPLEHGTDGFFAARLRRR